MLTCHSDGEQSGPLRGRGPFAPDGVVTGEQRALRMQNESTVSSFPSRKLFLQSCAKRAQLDSDDGERL